MIKTYITDIGDRNANEDSMYIPSEESRPLFVVCDGMGGHKSGEIASKLAAVSMVEYVENYRGESIVECLTIASSYANSRVYAASAMCSEYDGMGTTLSAVYIDGDRFYTANVGDSRVYLYTGSELLHVTEDHSYVADLVRAGKLTPEQARVHPQKNLITRAVGIQQHESADVFTTTWQEGDIILMCSDGLYDGATDDEIFNALKNIPDPDAVCRELVYLAREGGSGDNISIILIKYGRMKNER